MPGEKPFSEYDLGLEQEDVVIANDVTLMRQRIETDSNEDEIDDDLAKLAILRRAELARNCFNSTEKGRQMASEFARTYKNEGISNGLDICIDPRIDPILVEKSIKPFLSYIKSERYKRDLQKLDQALPNFYKKGLAMPPIFIHSEEAGLRGMTRYGDPAGMHFDDNILGNVHMVANHSMPLREVFLHEMVHNSEPLLTEEIEVFREGIATMAEYEISQMTSCQYDVVSAAERLRGVPSPSKHPFRRSFSNSNATNYNITIGSLIEWHVKDYENAEDWEKVESFRKYDVQAAFLQFYKQKFDKDLMFLASLSEKPNHSYLNKLVFDLERTGKIDQEYLYLMSMEFEIALPEGDQKFIEVIKRLRLIDQEQNNEDLINILNILLQEGKGKVIAIQDDFNGSLRRVRRILGYETSTEKDSLK